MLELVRFIAGSLKGYESTIAYDQSCWGGACNRNNRVRIAGRGEGIHANCHKRTVLAGKCELPFKEVKGSLSDALQYV